jgi:hypothetical protein
MKYYTIPNAVLELKYNKGRMVVEADSLHHAKSMFEYELLHCAEVAINTKRVEKKLWNKDLKITLNVEDIEVLE